MPGMGIISASTILAEIGDFRDFSSPDKLAAYCGLVPSVYQSAGKLINGHITKHGSPHIRAMIIEVAHAIIRSKQNSRLKKFFLRIKARRGTKIGVVALGRKVLCILFHLIISQELLPRWVAQQTEKTPSILVRIQQLRWALVKWLRLSSKQDMRSGETNVWNADRADSSSFLGCFHGNLQESISLFAILLTGPILASGKVLIPKTMEFWASLLDRLSDSGQLFRLPIVSDGPISGAQTPTLRGRKHFYKNIFRHENGLVCCKMQCV